MKDITKMQFQTKCIRRKSFAFALSIGIPILMASPMIAEDTPTAKGKTKSVPAYVAAHFEKAKMRSVHANKAVVRSGPSDKYYATSTLSKGATVEVYMETSDGWSGIRPPAGSHDWIPSNIAYLLPGGKSAEITEDKSPAWVGSDSSDVSEFMWQLELAKSQQVQVLGEETQLTEDGSKLLWYRIAPPQGEFRWVKTSHLSDSLPTNAKESGVQLASFVDDSSSSPVSTNANTDSGKIVWSDERKSLEQVEAQIKQEQAEIQRKMEADGIRVNIESPKLDAKSKLKAKLVSGQPRLAASNDLSNTHEHEVIQSTSPSQTSIRPIPDPTNQRRGKTRTQSAEHQIDGQRQWEAMQSTDPKRRIKPLGSILGLIGLSVIEADQAPISTQIAQQYHTAPSQGNIGRIGPVGNSRLDRLPRPGKQPSMTLPADGSDMVGAPMGTEFGGWNGLQDSMSHPMQQQMHPSMQQPMQQGETTFSRWINSRQPLFGPSQPTYGPMVASGMQTAPQQNTFGPPNPMQPPMGQMHPDTTAWHGLSPSQRSANSQPLVGANGSVGADGADVEQFTTPEIQSALVHLTQEVAGPTEQWDFSAIKNQAASWVENGATVLVRGEARLLMERIERFESLRQRTLGFAQDASMIAQQAIGNASAIRQASSVTPVSSNPGFANNSNNNSNNSNAVSNAIATNPMSEGDASGWLVQVHTTIKGQPEFALTDDAGKVIAYVQSSPAINLRRYLQQPVTVYGVRGYIPNLAAKQILAERVVRMR